MLRGLAQGLLRGSDSASRASASHTGDMCLQLFGFSGRPNDLPVSENDHLWVNLAQALHQGSGLRMSGTKVGSYLALAARHADVPQSVPAGRIEAARRMRMTLEGES